jgi:hypothetical protein
VSSLVPDLVEEIIGYRAWRVDPACAQPRLRSPVFVEAEAWPNRSWHAAACSRNHDAPAEGCSCGIYAARDRAHLVDQAYNEESDASVVVVIGEVGLAGKVIVCQQGYRAAKARPVRLWVPYEHWPLANRLRDHYRVPVSLDNTLRP